MTARPSVLSGPASSRARHRVASLVSGSTTDDLETRFVRHVVGLGLPGLDDEATVRRLGPRVRVSAGFAAVLILAAYGSLGLVLLAALVVVVDVAARRTAPARRLAVVERQLPTVLESVARRLRAGGSLAQALADATPDRPADLRASWSALVRRIPTVGIEASLDAWSRSSELPSVRLAGAALALAASTGGSPARAIDGVSATLRARLALADEIRALSSQARASAIVIAGSPLLFGAAAAATDDRTGAFLRTPLGVLLVGSGLLVDLAGWRWMSRLCRPAGASW